MSEWISVKDKFPDHDNYVLTFSTDSFPPVRMNCYSIVWGEWNKNSGGKITHWMPLPEEPKE